MPTLPLHPAVVHVPLGLAFIVPLLAGGLAMAYRRRVLPRAAFGILVGAQALLVAGGVVAMQLGERDEKQVEAVVGDAAIERHEERAELFVWASGLVLAGTVAILVVPAGAVTAAAAVVAAAALGVAGLAIAAGEAGGAIVYQHGGGAAFAPRGPAPAALASPVRVRDRHHDDD